MNLKQSEVFVRVAEMGSFSKAAPELDLAQPALSRHVRLLETGLRVALLQRTGLPPSIGRIILALVRAGHGHAVLAPSALAAAGDAAALRARPLAGEALRSTLCTAVSAHKPATPLLRRALRLLHELVPAHVGPADNKLR